MRWINVARVGLLSLVLQTGAWADPTTDAVKLRDEARQILEAGSGLNSDPKKYAEAVIKLENALDMLEKAGSKDDNLMSEITNQLFWARKFTTNEIIHQIDVLRGGKLKPSEPLAKKPTEPVKPKEPAKPAEASNDGSTSLADARKVFEEADKYAKAHSSDDFAVALNWFVASDKLQGTDYAIKAITLAREAQERHTAKLKPVDTTPETPASKIIKEGDIADSQGKYDEAVTLYKSSLKMEDTILGHRRLGHAYFKKAQSLKDALMPQFEAADAEYRTAWKDAWVTIRTMAGSIRRFNENYAPLVASKQKIQQLGVKANEAVRIYDDAATEFIAVLKKAEGGKDLDAVAHQALCYSVRAIHNPFLKPKAVGLLIDATTNYTPANDVDRTLQEFCRMELLRLQGKKA